jgi:hypothetical protein
VRAVKKGTFLGSLCLVVASALASSPAWGRNGNQAEGSVTVSVFNDADVPEVTLKRAEELASRVFRQAGMKVDWVNCGMADEAPKLAHLCTEVIFPTHLHLRILRRAKSLSASTFGISYLGSDGSGCYSDLFVEQAEELQEKFGLELAPVLGHVAAHEIGHLLLGTNSHAAKGIMRARWNAEELTEARRDALVFSEAQGQLMREHLATGLVRNAKAILVAAAPAGH